MRGTLFLCTLLLWLATAQQDIPRRYLRNPAIPGSKDRNYIVHLPRGYTTTRRYPEVLVLHGCNQDHNVIKRDTQFDQIADNEGFIAVYVFITSYDGIRNLNCWGFWFANEIARGRGEVADLNAVALEVAGLYSVDRARIHITGLSSGGAMTVAAVTAYPDTFASAAPAAGIGYAETASTVTVTCLIPPITRTAAQTATSVTNAMGSFRRPVPMMILHSTSDCTVQILNAERNRDSWGIVFGVNTATPVRTTQGTTLGAPWVWRVYGNVNGRSLIELHTVSGIAHGWVGGAQGQYSFPNGPRWAQLAWDFFNTHPMLAEEFGNYTKGGVEEQE